MSEGSNKRSLALGVAASLLCLVSGLAAAHDVSYSAYLDGNRVVNPNGSKGSGSSATGDFEMTANEQTQRFTVVDLSVTGISPAELDQSHGDNGTAIQICLDQPGEASEVILIDLGWYIRAGHGTLTATPDGFQATVSGVLTSVQGAYDMEATTGFSPYDAMKEIELGHTFVQVHTKSHPHGEIRGAIPAAGASEGTTWGEVKSIYERQR